MRTREKIEEELASIRRVHPAEPTKIAFLERSLGETLRLMGLIEELLLLVPLTVGIAQKNVARKIASRIKS